MLRATVTVPSRVEFVRPATAFLVHAARAFKVAKAVEPVFEVALSEAITNAVKHGGHDIESTISCEIELEHSSLIVRILDDGGGFVMDDGTLPDVSPDGIEALRSSGYGLPIIHSVFPVVRVVTVEGRFGLELALPTRA